MEFAARKISSISAVHAAGNDFTGCSAKRSNKRTKENLPILAGQVFVL